MTTTIAQRINELVAEHGSLVKAARHLDMDVAYLSRLRSGIKDAPSDETLARLGLAKRVTYTRADTEHPGPRAKRDRWGIASRSRTTLRDIANALAGKLTN